MLETGEVNTYAFDSGGFYRRKNVWDRRQGYKRDDQSRGPKASPVHRCSGITKVHERTAQHSPLLIDRLTLEARLQQLWFLPHARRFLLLNVHGTERPHKHGVGHIVFIQRYYYYCLRLIGDDSGLTRSGHVSDLQPLAVSVRRDYVC